MLKNRLIVTITIGYIIGIIMGLYYKKSIVLLYLIIYIICLIKKEISKRKKLKRKFKLISIKRYFRYIKLIIPKKVLNTIILCSIISNSIVLYQNNKYNNLYKELNSENVFAVATVVSNIKEKEYTNKYKIKIESINGNNKFKNTKLYFNVKKDSKCELQFGDRVEIKGVYEEPSRRRN